MSKKELTENDVILLVEYMNAVNKTSGDYRAYERLVSVVNTINKYFDGNPTKAADVENRGYLDPSASL